jgi:hypothetical protein
MLPFADPYQRISEGLGNARQVEQGARQRFEANSPADPNIQQLIRAVAAGKMTPFEASVVARAGKQQPPPNMPDAAPVQAPAMPPMQAQRGPWAGGYDKGPPPPSRTPGPWGGGYDSGPSQAQFEEDITVQAPSPQRQAPQAQTGDLDLLSGPIRNRDVPTLVSLIDKIPDSGDNEYKRQTLELRRQELRERQRQFDDQASLRQAREELARATASGIPERIELAKKNYQARLWGLGLSERRTDMAEGVNYMKLSGDADQMIASIDQLMAEVEASPALAPPPSDYTKRRMAEIARGIPFGGNALGEVLEKVADQQLTPQQREVRRQISLIAQKYRHANFGSALTATENRIINELTGQQTSWPDTVAGFRALQQYARNHQRKMGNLFPGAAQRVGSVQPGQALPRPSSGLPSGMEGFQQPGYQPRPMGPETEEGGDLDLLLQGGR